MVKAGCGNGETSSSSLKLDRKTIEKNRRIHMKSLCSKLFNLVHPSHFKIPKDLLSQQNQISYVIAYINELKERVENLEKRKHALVLQTSSHNSQAHLSFTTATATTTNDSTLPMIELRNLGNDVVHVMLTNSPNKSFMLYQIINIVEEEGGQVININFSTLGNKVFYSLHIEAKISRIGVETSRVLKRLQNLIN